jgi:hypothetical protein
MYKHPCTDIHTVYRHKATQSYRQKDIHAIDKQIQRDRQTRKSNRPTDISLQNLQDYII